MDYEKIHIRYILVFVIICLTGCKSNNRIKNFYVEYHTTNDTLKHVLENVTSGKVAYFDNAHRLQIVPVSYLTEDHADVHYFKVIGSSGFSDNSIKYEVNFSAKLLTDSTYYSIKKYKYANGKWKLGADMGAIKAYSNITGINKKVYFDKDELAGIILNTIAKDSYSY